MASGSIIDRQYLKIIATTYEGGPVGLEAVAATMSETPGRSKDMVEPFLLQLGFVARTKRARAVQGGRRAHRCGVRAPEPAVCLGSEHSRESRVPSRG